MNARALAASVGVVTNDPHLLAMYDAIRRQGIREARAGHYERAKLIDQFKASPALFFATIRPALSTQECIDDATRTIFGFRNLPTWQRNNPARLERLAKAKQMLVVARFFRRYGERVWAREAA